MNNVRFTYVRKEEPVEVFRVMVEIFLDKSRVKN